GGCGSAWRRHAPTPWTGLTGLLAGGGHRPHLPSWVRSPPAPAGGGGGGGGGGAWAWSGWGGSGAGGGWARPTWRPEAMVRWVWRGSSVSRPERSAARRRAWWTVRARGGPRGAAVWA